MNEIIQGKPNQLVDPQAQRIVDYLESVGLPSEHIIAAAAEREIIGNNLPAFIDKLPPEIKSEARYLSKFVVGAGYGPFDYSLTAVWNEVIVDLLRPILVILKTSFLSIVVGS